MHVGGRGHPSQTDLRGDGRGRGWGLMSASSALYSDLGSLASPSFSQRRADGVTKLNPCEGQSRRSPRIRHFSGFVQTIVGRRQRV